MGRGAEGTEGPGHLQQLAALRRTALRRNRAYRVLGVASRRCKRRSDQHQRLEWVDRGTLGRAPFLARTRSARVPRADGRESRRCGRDIRLFAWITADDALPRSWTLARWRSHAGRRHIGRTATNSEAVLPRRRADRARSESRGCDRRCVLDVESRARD